MTVRPPVTAPVSIDTARLVLRRLRADDVEAMFRYASDPDVTRYVGWPQHTALEHTKGFLAYADSEWERWPAGPYAICDRRDGRVIGGTGLSFDAPATAMTGYVLSKDSWGNGFATEALLAMVDLAPRLGVTRLYALCHPDHRASWRVLEKSGFTREGILARHVPFPNIAPGVPVDVLCYARAFPQG
jgi:ribosomal-protein-alanine N-acetyltransferase